ncbi:unnamed protein product [Pleuronectes platessa]|uniref:Uncharacterized protein n=1 Tax=Pleuronectes platessa TaxID=8262 RepID=A0A9N7V7A2_PLEPL|nr:unnamed protein product [Pleuronectes platessa]
MASHSPATILGVETGTKWQLKTGGNVNSRRRTFPHFIDRPKRHAGKDEIGRKPWSRRLLRVDKLAFLRAAALSCLAFPSSPAVSLQPLTIERFRTSVKYTDSSSSHRSNSPTVHRVKTVSDNGYRQQNIPERTNSRSS